MTRIIGSKVRHNISCSIQVEHTKQHKHILKRSKLVCVPLHSDYFSINAIAAAELPASVNHLLADALSTVRIIVAFSIPIYVGTLFVEVGILLRVMGSRASYYFEGAMTDSVQPTVTYNGIGWSLNRSPSSTRSRPSSRISMNPSDLLLGTYPRNYFRF